MANANDILLLQAPLRSTPNSSCLLSWACLHPGSGPGNFCMMTTLQSVRPGAKVKVLKLDVQPEICCRLREMGFAENSVIRCVQSGAAMVCQIQHARVGLSQQLAAQIYVEPA